MSHPIQQYRLTHRWMKTFVNLLTAFKSAVDGREALIAFVEAELEKFRAFQPEGESILLNPLTHQFYRGGDLVLAIQNSSIQRKTGSSRLSPSWNTTSSSGDGSQMWTKNGRKPIVTARWFITTLEEALLWMILV